MSNLANDQKVVQSIEPVARTVSTVNGTAVDWTGYNEVLATIAVGVIGATTTATITLEHCDTSGGSYVVLATSAALAAADDQLAYALGAKRVASSKKYVRATIAVAGDNSALVGVVLVLSKPKQAPAT